MVSISPVPKLEPGPVSYSHWESTPEPEAPVKSSLKIVDQPEGAPGTVCGAAAAVAAAAVAAAAAPAGSAGAAEAAGCATVSSARTRLIAAAAISARV
jgi:hypothetical protein